jgi:hypothetical protein
MQLVRRDAFLARGHEVRGEKPLVQRDMATLENGAHHDGEVLPALIGATAIPARLLRRIGVVDRATVRANRTIGPADFFEEFAGRVLIVKVRHG